MIGGEYNGVHDILFLYDKFYFFVFNDNDLSFTS
jgi:hypothetical protein